MAALVDIIERVKAAVSPQGVADEDDFAFSVTQLVHPELEALARDLARDRHLRRHVLTDPATVTVTLSSGVGDLSSAVTNHGVLLDRMKYGVVTHDGLSYPLRHVEEPTHGSLSGQFDTMFARYWLVGPQIYTKGTDGAGLAGPLALAVPRVPGLDQVAGKVEGMLVDRISARMKKGGKGDNRRTEG